jgi:hypothetical protein
MQTQLSIYGQDYASAGILGGFWLIMMFNTQPTATDMELIFPKTAMQIAALFGLL